MKSVSQEDKWLKTHKPKWIGRWAWFVNNTMVRLIMFLYPKAEPVKADLAVGDEGLPLDDYGIPGRILYTPGRTVGSLNVLLDSGEAFVGDLAMNKFPLRRNPGLPVLADDIEKVKDSWRNLMALGAVTVYPGHGKPFPIRVIREALL